jgi:hypothetical protein
LTKKTGPKALRGDHQTTQCRSDRPRDIHRDAAQRDGSLQILARYQVRRERLPCRRHHRGADAEREREPEQQPVRHQALQRQPSEQRRGDQHPRLRDEQQATAIDDVGERSCRQRDEKERQAGRRRHQRHHDR